MAVEQEQKPTPIGPARSTLEPLRAEPIIGDGDDGDDDEDDDEIVVPSASRPPLTHSPERQIIVTRPGPATASAETVARTESATQAKEAVKDFHEILGALDIKALAHKIHVFRMKPERGTYDDGEEIPLKGICGEVIEYRGVESIPDEDFIRERFGGGLYEIRVFGPAANGKGWIRKATREIPIPGPPILPHRRKAPGSQDAVLKTVLEQNEKERVRLAKEAADARERNDRLLMEQSKRQDQMMMTMMGPQKSVEQIAAEREERRLEAEKAERRHQEAIAEARRQHDLQLKQMELQQQRQIEEARLQQATAQRQFEMQMQAQRDSQAAALAAQQAQAQQQAQQQQQQMQMQMKQMEMQQAAQQAAALAQQNMSMQMMQQQQTAAQQQMNLMTQLMTSANSEKSVFLEKLLTKKDDDGDGFDKLLKMKEVIDVFSGKSDGEDGRETWEKVLDKVTDNLPKLPSMLQAANQLRGPQQQPATKKGLAPGSVVAAAIPEKAVEQLPAQTTTGAPTTEGAQPETITIDPSANDLTEFRGPTTEEINDIPTSLKILVQNIDLAMQRDLTAEQIKDRIVSQWPPEQVQLLTMQDAQGIVDAIEERTPDSWKIVSPGGKRTLRELHALLVGG